MARLGVGGAFLRVTEALLSNTRARAVVNGAMSRAVDFPGWRPPGVPPSAPVVPLSRPGPGQVLGISRHYQWVGNG